MRSLLLTLACTLSALSAAPALVAQTGGLIIGTAYDSLRRAPLGGAEVQLRGSTRHAVADSNGRFRFDALTPGPYTLELTHPALDAAGIYVLTSQATVDGTRPAVVQIGSPSLTTVWQRVCGRPTPFGTSDTAVVFGSVSDAATRTRFAGATVTASWRALRSLGTEVAVQPLGARVRTDSLGNYYICGATNDVTVRVRAYAGGDSSGAIDLLPAGGPVQRRDFTVGQSLVRRATLRGVVLQADGVTPLPDAQVVVEEGRQRFADGNGRFVIDSLPSGTRWLVVRAVGQTPSAQAVDLRDGDTVMVRVTLEAAPVVLDTVRVVSRISKELEEFEARRRTGFGFMITEDQIKHRANMRSVFIGVPQLRVVGPAVGQFSLVYEVPSGGTCVPIIFIDGRQGAIHELYAFVPAQIAAVESYSRTSTVPVRFQTAMPSCGVLVVWTKTLQ